MKIPDEQVDKEWEQEKPLWDAEQNGDPDFKDAVSLAEFKQLLEQFFNDKWDLNHDDK